MREISRHRTAKEARRAHVVMKSTTSVRQWKRNMNCKVNELKKKLELPEFKTVQEARRYWAQEIGACPYFLTDDQWRAELAAESNRIKTLLVELKAELKQVETRQNAKELQKKWWEKSGGSGLIFLFNYF